MSSANGKKLLALSAAAVLGSTAVTASAAPYITVNLLGSVNGGPYSSALTVATGDVVSYQVQVQLAPEGTTNPFPPTGTANRSISNWLPSDSATPTGLNTFAFSLTQTADAGVQVDFDAPTSTDAGWTQGLAYTPGTVSPRGNGNDDLDGVILNRALGAYDGIAGDGTNDILELLTIASGMFDVTSATSSGVLTIGVNDGFASTTQQIMATRWRNAANTGNVNTSYTIANQQASVAGSDPIITFNSLALNVIPEPASLGLLGLGAIGALGRRRRA